MKDLTNYTYVELYDMLTHINPYKYADRLEAVRKELDLRKEQGEVPTNLVPKTDWSVFRFRRKNKGINNAQIA
jgi:hypothetical protein